MGEIGREGKRDISAKILNVSWSSLPLFLPLEEAYIEIISLWALLTHSDLSFKQSRKSLASKQVIY